MNAKYPQLIILHFPCLGGGNAAGFLAKRGLLMSGGGRGHGKENNSSDTDSDTEEYLSNVHRYLNIPKNCILLHKNIQIPIFQNQSCNWTCRITASFSF